jgi:hypothetical protein
VTRRLTTLFALLATFLLTQLSAWAQAVSGAVINRTSGKPASGIEVALVDPMQGMAELVKTTTDAQGRYSLNGPPAQGPRLVRATRDGVSYFRMVPPGIDNIAVDVYDAARKLDGIEGTANVMRVQADGNNLQVVQLFAVNNTSSPPRTLNGVNTLEFVLPEGAQLDGADAQGPNGQPISVIPEELKQKGHYAFRYALKPGETRFQVGYRMPYKGAATLAPAVLQSWRHVVVMAAPGMTWTPKDVSLFKPMNDQQSGSTLQVATNVQPGQDLSFQLSGSGSFPSNEEQAQGGETPAPRGADNRPGGGMAPPIDAPDALARYRWMILGVLAVVLSGCAYLSVSRRPTTDEAAAAAPMASAAIADNNGPGRVFAAWPAGDPLLETIKQELFQLEVERQQAAISPADYEKQKAALDQVLQRALARKKV